MTITATAPNATWIADRYGRCIEASKRIRWDIETDVIRGREFNLVDKFLPDGLSLVRELDFLSEDEQRFLSQVQGRTYANIFGLAERFINAKILELSRDYWLGDQTALEGLLRFSDEELKHQALFRRIEGLAESVMPPGYVFSARPNEVAAAVLGKSTWSVLVLTLHIELFTQQHYRESIRPDERLSPLYRDVFLFHWKEESQHAVMDELELLRHNATLADAERDDAVDDFIDLVGAVDGVLQTQSINDTRYFLRHCGRTLPEAHRERVAAVILQAYRWQYILSGAQNMRFAHVLAELLTDEQLRRVHSALASLEA